MIKTRVAYPHLPIVQADATHVTVYRDLLLAMVEIDGQCTWQPFESK